MKRIHIKKEVSGVTLLEVLLALVIALSILFFSLQQYAYYKRDADAQRVQSTVDLLFQGLGKYFRAHCDRTLLPGDTVDDFRKFYAPVSKSISVQTLIDEGYILLPNNQIPNNPLVGSGGSSPSYILQFNQYQIPARPTPLLPMRTVDLSTSPATSTGIGSQLIWQAQVSVKLQDTSIAPALLGILAGTCLSNSTANASGLITTPCSSAPVGANQYVVWQRAPSFTSAGAQSDLWISMPTARQFKQMYTTDPILILTDPSAGVKPQRDAQYFTCGS